MKTKTINTKELRDKGIIEGFYYTLYDENGKRIEQNIPLNEIKNVK